MKLKNMTHNINFIFYGKLKSSGSLNFFLPKRRAKKKDLVLDGYKIYKKRFSFIALKSEKGDRIEAEFWTFNLKYINPGLFLFFLDLLEGVFLAKYKRIIENTEYGEAWIYVGQNKNIK